MANHETAERLKAIAADREKWALLTPEQTREWDGARDELAAALGWAPGPRVKRRSADRGKKIEEWVNAPARKPGEDVFGSMVLGPTRLADESERAAAAGRQLWSALAKLAEEEKATDQASGGSDAKEDSQPEWMKKEGLARLAPNAERRLPRAMAAIEQAAAEGLSNTHIFTLCATSVCQCAEWAFWSSGRRVESGGEAFESLLNLLYDENPKGTWLAVLSCWDARALGLSREGKVWREYEKGCVMAHFLNHVESPWALDKKLSKSVEKERKIQLDAIWESRWMKMALSASAAKEAPFEFFASDMWKMAILRNYCSEIDYWRYAAAQGVSPALVDARGQNALHWLCSPMAETGSEGYFVLLQRRHIEALRELGPDVDWMAADREGQGPFDEAQRSLEQPDRKKELAENKALALALSERKQIGDATKRGEAKGDEAAPTSAQGGSSEERAPHKPHRL